jgi:hypothetical protein
MRFTNRNWGMALLGGWTAFITAAWIWNHRPASMWFEPGPITVADAVAGECPSMTYSRQIHQPFHGVWRVTIRQITAGGPVVWRVWLGENDYRPDATLPEHLDLGWWLWVDACNLPPGEYDMLSTWQIEPDLPGVRTAGVLSNRFTIHPSPKGTP